VEPKVVSRMEVIGGLRTHFLVAGAGEPLLLVHGIGSSVITWRYNIETLAQHFRVYAVDLIGHGMTEKPHDKRRYTIDEAVWFLGAFCDAQGLGRVCMLGRSMGGLLTLAFALRYPERIRRAVISGSGGLGREVGFPLRLASIPLLGSVLATPTRLAVQRSWDWMFYDTRKVPQELVEEDYRNQNIPGNKKALLTMARWGLALSGQRQRVVLAEQLHAIETLVLVLAGKEDRVIPVVHAQRAAALLPNAELHLFDQCGHFPQIEKKDEFHDVVLRFLVDEEAT